MAAAWIRLAGLLALGACGDNAVPCGVGTTEVDGQCTAPPPVACDDGTKLSNGRCVLDPEICQAGTVLIADRCVDPLHDATIDLEEGPEPNGFSVAPGVERGAAPAGAFDVPAVGTTFLVHGHLSPFRDDDGDGQLDPDVDTYVITAAGPAVLAISVDGVGGIEGAFYLTAALTGPPTRRYERYGLALTGDTARRRLYLPIAGDYQLAIADARSIAIGDNPPPAAGHGAAAGGPTAEYFASITVDPLPAAAEISLTGGVASQTGALGADDIALFTAALGATSTTLRLTMSGPAAAALAVSTGDALAGYAEENSGDHGPASEAQVTINGPAASPVIAVDAVYNVGPALEPFTLAIATP